MATPAKRSTSPKRSKKDLSNQLPENHTPSEAVAHGIISRYGDLTPSVNRIMHSGLGEDAMMHAISLFKDSLGVPGDPYRDPANALEAGRLLELNAEAQAAQA